MNSDDRNRWLTLIVVASIAMLVMSFFTQRKPLPPQQPQSPANGENAAQPENKPEAKPIPSEVPKFILVETDELRLTLCSAGAAVEKAELLKYHPNAGESSPLVLLDGLARDQYGPRRSMVLTNFSNRPMAATGPRSNLDFEHWPFKLVQDDGPFTAERSARTVRFEAEQEGLKVVKTFTFARQGFDIRLAVNVINGAGEAQTFDYQLVGGAGIRHDEPEAARQADITAKLAGRNSSYADMEFRDAAAADAPGAKPESLVLSKALTEWAALRGRYFAAILVPEDPAQAIAAFAEPLVSAEPDKKNRNLVAGLRCASFTLKPGEAKELRYFLRLGPQKAGELETYSYTEQPSGKTVNRGLVASVDFSSSWFARPARWLLRLLLWLGRLVGNYGIAIFLLTLVVKLALHPLQRKGTMTMQKSQGKMQALAPKLKVLQEQYKDDRAKLQAAQMRLYKEEGVNPAGMVLGCLPMAFQMPVWFALYGAIRGAFELRQESFLWVSDLSRPDTVLNFHFWPLEWWPGGLNILPLLYAGLMLVQSFSTPLPVDPQQRQQAQMMRFMPLMFFFIIYKMPSAFVLYFAANAILSYGETWWIKKQMARLKAAEAVLAASAGGDGPAAGQGEKPAPVTNPDAFWAAEAQKKLGKK